MFISAHSNEVTYIYLLAAMWRQGPDGPLYIRDVHTSTGMGLRTFTSCQ